MRQRMQEHQVPAFSTAKKARNMLIESQSSPHRPTIPDPKSQGPRNPLNGTKLLLSKNGQEVYKNMPKN
eukprot:5066161-Amphidinium_carterae.1